MNKVFALLIAAALPAAALAQPTVEPLKLNADNKLYCNAQTDWCVGINTEGTMETNGPYATSRTLRTDRKVWDLPDIPNFKSFTVWPHLIRLSEERAIVGVIGPSQPDYNLETPFSGGSFTREDLYLFEVDLGESTSSNLVFIMPKSASASIRACFNQADEKKRAGQCMDAYRYQAELAALPGTAGATGKEYPDLQVTTQATRAPAGASRYADSTKRPALTAAQAAPAADMECSYTATYRWNPDGGLYEPAKPVPDCSEFLDVTPKAKP
ncbi:hypothetical protein [Achromobacter kerstersii]|uniref:hypothetical protein n=1 Tax=Achromobacter kerstersii TaxID=1353890 RepID=UPI00313AF367